MGGFECLDQLLARSQGEVARPHAHLDQHAAKLAADLGEVGGAVGGAEGVLDLAFTGRVGDAVGHEPDHRDRRQHDDAGANRDAGDEAVE